VQLDADERVEVATPSSLQYAIRSTTVLASTSLLASLDLPRSVSRVAVDLDVLQRADEREPSRVVPAS